MFANVHLYSITTLVLLVGNAPLGSQAFAGERIRFETCDGVSLRGTYYPGKGRESCPVMLLHELGEDDGMKAITTFAEALQKKGHAVLTFDFRGHGESTQVDGDAFWSNRYANRALVRSQSATEITFKDFDPRYYPILVNDIAAAKAFWDRRNDDGDCNSNNLIVIGFERGATLGALWVNSEFYRHQVFAPQFPNRVPQIAQTSEGTNILAAIWFSLAPKLGSRKVNLPALVYTPGKSERMPTVFIYGDNVETGKRIAEQCEKVLKGKKVPFTGSTEAPKAGDGRGAELLKNPATVNAVLEYIANVAQEEANEREQQDFRQSQYLWKLQRGYQGANRAGDSTLNYNTYDAFLPLR
jgi:hypothetical protein